MDFFNCNGKVSFNRVKDCSKLVYIDNMFLRAFIFSQMRICSFIGGTGINKASKLSEFRVAPLMAVLVFPF